MRSPGKTACAKLLVDKGLADPKRLGIFGASNGRLLMGAALTQHPEMYRAVLSRVGIYDMLRVESEPNPAVLFMTGANEARVDPEHSRKMTARLQSATSSKLPVLLRTSALTRQGIGTPRDARLAETADAYAFLFAQLGVSYKTPSLATASGGSGP